MFAPFAVITPLVQGAAIWIIGSLGDATVAAIIAGIFSTINLLIGLWFTRQWDRRRNGNNGKGAGYRRDPRHRRSPRRRSTDRQRKTKP